MNKCMPEHKNNTNDVEWKNRDYKTKKTVENRINKINKTNSWVKKQTRGHKTTLEKVYKAQTQANVNVLMLCLKHKKYSIH